ncbi:uncharacterized protein LOC113231062 [Hyposmocoma kahamanoa]|uniref:uncharacterized protein LOC113231062 n=1 Tax=Hyposmocoma kahamanoa TaxID=1477025 RepID=UPI000E6D6867|nr:uncharacterized protein LOC113231062 [Hyposmocoma kahamanoa]
MTTYRIEPSWQQEDVINNIVADDPLAVIYNEGQWRISRVSPLYKLEYKAVKLKQYGTKVRQAIVSSVTTNTPTKYTVKFESQPNLVYNEEDAPGLLITISSTQENTKKTKLAYTAALLSWGVFTVLDNAVHLPYMLERGEQKLGVAVKDTLQTLFDCQVKQYQFTQNQLLHIGLKFLENDTSVNRDPFVFVYKTPQVDLKDKLTIALDIGDMKIIWNGVQQEVGNKSELVNLAYQILQNQIFCMISLDISVLQLCELILPKAEVKSSGIIKMKTPENVNCLFTTLNEVDDANSSKVSDVSH